jgi:uncharacterized membrane protein SpoIIM required for sporulation/ABC-type transport system involved in multi-copper enzyme maturation permease subunit
MATTLRTDHPTHLAETNATDMLPPRPASQIVLPQPTWRDTLRNALIITRREMRDSFRDWRIMAPIILLTLVFPSLAQGMTGIFTSFFVNNGAAPLIDNFLPLLPMIVGFFPVSISLVIALETFVGEKERRSLEPLLSTPLTNTELYLGKTFAAMIPPLLASYVGIGIYVSGLILGEQQWRPDPELIIQILALTTAQALVMVTGAVVVSSQTTSTRASNLLASFIIIPISLLVLVESYIMITNRRYVLWFMLAGLVVADIMLFSMGARIFNREELLGRTIDQVNLRWAWRLFAEQFRGGKQARGLVGWYRHSVLPALTKLRAPMLIVLFGLVGMFIGGYIVAQVNPDLQIPASAAGVRDDLLNNFQLAYSLGSGPISVPFVIGNNLRVLIAATLLSIFTFGVMGIFFAALPFGILGFLFGQPVMAALGVGTFLAAIMTHGVFEIPAILIAAAGAARLGACITRPPAGQGVWEAWVRTLADVVKVFVAVVIPMLIIAAFIEVYITPRVVLAVLGR